MKTQIYKTENEINNAITIGFDFVLLYKLSEINIISYSDFNKLDNEVTEARFFDSKKELRIFDYNGEKRGCLIEDDENDTLNKTNLYPRKIKGKFKYKKAIIKEYLEFDEDGQIYVKAVRLYSLE